MKRGLITAIICLSLVFVMLVGVVSAVCGDDVIDAGETCDNGTAANTDTPCTAAYDSTCTYCNTTCQTKTVTGSYCGDSTTDTSDGEQCDDGNIVGGDGCSADCLEIESDIQVTTFTDPTDMCGADVATGLYSGLLCNETAAENYCTAPTDINGLGYEGYVTNSIICDETEHTKGNLANSDTNAGIGFCYADEGDGDGTTEWITSMKCYKTAGVAGTCTENDTSTDLAEQFVFGNASEGGVDWLDSCIDTDTLNESYCDNNGQLASRVLDCSEGCSDGVCETPAAGLYCPENNGTESPIAGLPRVSPTSRDRADDDELYYCGLDQVWHETLELTETCTSSYECISNSCVEGECYGVRTELEEQRNILVKIWCFLTNMGEYLQNRADIQAADDVIDDIKIVAPDYGSCLEAPFGAD